jgi:hypothetical protein
VTPLTLSSAVKASPFGIMSWRCLAPSEHGIARPRTWHALGGFRQDLRSISGSDSPDFCNLLIDQNRDDDVPRDGHALLARASEADMTNSGNVETAYSASGKILGVRR